LLVDRRDQAGLRARVDRAEDAGLAGRTGARQHRGQLFERPQLIRIGRRPARARGHALRPLGLRLLAGTTPRWHGRAAPNRTSGRRLTGRGLPARFWPTATRRKLPGHRRVDRWWTAPRLTPRRLLSTTHPGRRFALAGPWVDRPAGPPGHRWWRRFCGTPVAR